MTTEGPKILLIEDEQEIRRFCESLVARGIGSWNRPRTRRDAGCQSTAGFDDFDLGCPTSRHGRNPTGPRVVACRSSSFRPEDKNIKKSMPSMLGADDY
jgi:hypothetical protein